MADFDRDAVIERAKIEVYDKVEDADWGNAYDATAAALPVIVAATLAPIEALHGPSGWSSICGCGEAKPCQTAQAIADIKAKAGA